MTNDHQGSEDPSGTIEDLRRELAALRERAECSEAQMQALHDELALLRPRGQSEHREVLDLTSSTAPGGTEEVPDGGRVSRRGALLALGGAAAGGVGLAIGSAVLSSDPAAALPNPNLILDQTNAATAQTLVTGGLNSTPLFSVLNTGSTTPGTGVRGVGGGTSGLSPGIIAAGLWGDSSTGYGVIGTSSANSGVVGQTNANGEQGVYGIDTSPGGGYGVNGMTTKGTGVHGVGVAPSGITRGIVGVWGETTAGDGVFGTSTLLNGVVGVTLAGGQSGVLGSDDGPGGSGVFGASENAIGVKGQSSGASGLLGSAFAGVVGDSDSANGVMGISLLYNGVYGLTEGDGWSGIAGVDVSTTGGHGAFGRSTAGIGVLGIRTSGQSGLLGSTVAGVVGDSSSSDGVVGLSSSGNGVSGGTNVATGSGVTGSDTSVAGGRGVYGGSVNGAGLQGVSGTKYGLTAQGGLAPVQLLPSASAGAPSTGTHALGELYVDLHGVFYKCVVAGTPGTWVPLYSVVPLPAPVRVLSTPSGSGNTGGLTGPFAADGTTHTTSVLTGGATGIPSVAVGVVANLALSANGAPLNGDGYLTLFPAGITNPGTASINVGGDAFATSNGVTVAFGTGSGAGKLSFSWQGGGSPQPCQVFLDVTAYLL